MNGYASENSVFSFARPRINSRKMIKCRLEKLCGRARKLIQRFHWLPRLLDASKRENLFGFLDTLSVPACLDESFSVARGHNEPKTSRVLLSVLSDNQADTLNVSKSRFLAETTRYGVSRTGLVMRMVHWRRPLALASPSRECTSTYAPFALRAQI